MIIREEKLLPFIIDVQVGKIVVKEELKVKKDDGNVAYHVTGSFPDLNKAFNVIVDTILARNADIVSLYEYMKTRKELFGVLDEAFHKLSPPVKQENHEYEDVPTQEAVL